MTEWLVAPSGRWHLPARNGGTLCGVDPLPGVDRGWARRFGAAHGPPCRNCLSVRESNARANAEREVW